MRAICFSSSFAFSFSSALAIKNGSVRCTWFKLSYIIQGGGYDSEETREERGQEEGDQIPESHERRALSFITISLLGLTPWLSPAITPGSSQ